MTNAEVVDKFLNHERGHSLNMDSTGEKLYSYNTCMAQFIDGNLVVNKTKYSVTTSRHMSYLNTLLQKYNIAHKTVTEVERNAYSLKSYV